MAYPQFHYRWDLDLEASPEALWPLVADTNRFNRDSGVPPVERVVDPGLNNARQHLKLSRFGIPIEWEEEPFEWVRPFRFGVTRRYTAGPVAEMRTLAELEPNARGGTHLIYQVWARPRTLLGLAAIPAQVGVLGARTFNHTFSRYGELAMAETPTALATIEPPQLSEGAVPKLRQLRVALLAEGAPEGGTDRLIHFIQTGDDLAVSRIRPYALADAWGEPRRAVLELCLLSTRVGLLELRWDVLCPLCRGTKNEFDSLDDLGTKVHCEVCKINVSTNLDRFVEVTFRVSPAVRPVDVGEYCVGGPQVTPHIVAQQLMAPRETRSLRVPLEPGRYRVRTLKHAGGQLLMAAEGGDDEHSFVATGEDWPDDEQVVGLEPALELVNGTDDEQLMILERMAWSDQAATAAEVTVLQRFRDLFSREALRPGQPISVGSLAILFTDLRGSTRLYRHIGDAPAFGLVMDHFDVLRDAITAEGGSIVKTIGDAVMGAFLHPAAAVRAILRVQERLAALQGTDTSVVLKAGIHFGPCIAVTLNERLDYFGSSVNIAARLESLSRGNDVVVSSAVADDPEVATLLRDPERQLAVEPVEGVLKGLEAETIIMHRVTRQRIRDPEPAAAAVLAGPDGHAN